MLSVYTTLDDCSILLRLEAIRDPRLRAQVVGIVYWDWIGERSASVELFALRTANPWLPYWNNCSTRSIYRELVKLGYSDYWAAYRSNVPDYVRKVAGPNQRRTRFKTWHYGTEPDRHINKPEQYMTPYRVFA